MNELWFRFGSVVVRRWFSMCWSDGIMFRFGGLACYARLLCGSVCACVGRIVVGSIWLLIWLSCWRPEFIWFPVGSVVSGLCVGGSNLMQVWFRVWGMIVDGSVVVHLVET